MAVQNVDKCLQRDSWRNGNLMEVYGMSLGHTKICRKLTEFDERSPGCAKSLRMFTEDVTADESWQKVFWLYKKLMEGLRPHGKLAEVDESSNGRTET